MELDVALAQIRTIPDYPKPGIVFKDITPLLSNAEAFASCIKGLNSFLSDETVIVGIEARGFILASAMAISSERAFVPIRKAGKLPYETFSKSYGLEYGEDVIEVHTDAFSGHTCAIVVDDVLATGGTVLAALHLARETGVQVKKVLVLLEITKLGGRARIAADFPDIEVCALTAI